jgi:2-oxoisovalerate dehydrogenase E1 component
MDCDEILALYESTREQVIDAAKRAIATPKLTTAEEVMRSIAPTRPPKPQPEPMKPSEFAALLGNQFKFMKQPRNLCQNINYALHEVLHKYPNTIICGEDVGKKGGVYRVTADLQSRFGQRRVFDTMLDETSILGASIGAAQMGCIPIPEIQFLAYTHNAEDQIRGEAATLSFFSDGQYTNPMVIRIAGLAYQKGFGGHFHNDNAFAFLREIPGVIVACPSIGDDAALMFKECLRLADEQKRVVIFLEPIALYMTKDLHEKGDNEWLKTYPVGEKALPYGEPSVFNEPCKNAKEKVAIVTYGNGNFLSRQAEKVLRDEHQIESTIIDLRWLVPLHMDKVIPHLKGFDKVLIVDECRKTGSLSEEFITRLIEEAAHMPQVKRITGHDTFIPIGKSWEFVLPSMEDIVNTVSEWCASNPIKPAKKKAKA